MEITHTSFETCLERLTNHAVNDTHIARNDNFHLEMNRKEGVLFAMSVMITSFIFFAFSMCILMLVLFGCILKLFL